MTSESATKNRRWRKLIRIEAWLEKPMLVLSFLWLVLVFIELVWEIPPFLQLASNVIWIVFILEFLLKFTLAPDKMVFLKHDIIALIALIAPALRILRVLRFARLARGLRLVRVIGTANRGLRALERSFATRGLGYVLLATALVTLLGAGGTLAFEPSNQVKGGFNGYFDALWWTAMLVTTMGSGFWPETAEGRLLALFLSLFGLTVFGYITASFATFFIGREAKALRNESTTTQELAAIRQELERLRAELKQQNR